MKIKEFTICLHCGCCPEIVKNQMDSLRPLESKYKIFWNNRIDRHPGSYDSYSELINDSVATSKTEFVFLINDRTKPKPEDIEHMIELLELGFAAVTKYSVGFMAFSKELIREIGWWDERFYGGGYEDDDFVLRLRLHNLSYYESEESEYDQSWKSPLFPSDGAMCSKSRPWFNKKWLTNDTEIVRVIPEENYEKYNNKLGDRNFKIKNNWKDWTFSKIGIMFQHRIDSNVGGESRTYHFMDWRNNSEIKQVKSI
jgi:hypothetical protein